MGRKPKTSKDFNSMNNTTGTKVTHTTKYDIGDSIYWLEKRDGIYRIEHTNIKSINIGGKEYNKYEVSYTTRAEVDLFDSHEEARQEALNRQNKANESYLTIIREYKDK